MCRVVEEESVGFPSRVLHLRRQLAVRCPEARGRSGPHIFSGSRSVARPEASSLGASAASFASGSCELPSGACATGGFRAWDGTRKGSTSFRSWRGRSSSRCETRPSSLGYSSIQSPELSCGRMEQKSRLRRCTGWSPFFCSRKFADDGSGIAQPSVAVDERVARRLRLAADPPDRAMLPTGGPRWRTKAGRWPTATCT